MGKAEETKQRLMRAALKLFVRKGINETTTREIALGAGVAEGTIYRHFESKEELAWVLFRDHHLAIASALDEAQSKEKRLSDKTAAIIETYCRQADEDWLMFSYHLLAMHSHLDRVTDDMLTPVGVVRTVIGEAMASGEIAAGDVDVTASMVMGIVLQPAVHKIYGHIDRPLAAYSQTFRAAALKILTD